METQVIIEELAKQKQVNAKTQISISIDEKKKALGCHVMKIIQSQKTYKEIEIFEKIIGPAEPALRAIRSRVNIAKYFYSF